MKLKQENVPRLKIPLFYGTTDDLHSNGVTVVRNIFAEPGKTGGARENTVTLEVGYDQEHIVAMSTEMPYIPLFFCKKVD